MFVFCPYGHAPVRVRVCMEVSLVMGKEDEDERKKETLHRLLLIYIAPRRGPVVGLLKFFF